jgi:NAD(P)-dependent dehydrogenase (short-subunit alcohol dehydrogenase family)
MTTDDDTATPRAVLVTGANTGIGFVTARELARRGDRVIIACRSQDKADAAIAQIQAAVPRAEVSFLELDLADLNSVRDAVAALHQQGTELDVVVANAGVAGQRGQTAQGFELAFGINHVGHFAFVTGVLDLLRPSGGATDPARIVVVASGSHFDAKGIDFDVVHRSTASVTGLPEYAVSKLANVVFAQELARRLPTDEVWVGSLHPGTVASDVWRRVPWPIRPIMTRFMDSTDDGARTSIMLATDASVLPHRGPYYSKCELKEPSEFCTPALAAELWQRSEEWVEKYR